MNLIFAYLSFVSFCCGLHDMLDKFKDEVTFTEPYVNLREKSEKFRLKVCLFKKQTLAFIYINPVIVIMQSVS